MTVDKAALFAPRLPEADVDVPGVGTIRVRALSRAEGMRIKDMKGTEATERLILAMGMVDPALTEAEVGQWMKAAPAAEIEPVSLKIAELSGLLDGSAQGAYKSDGGQP